VTLGGLWNSAVGQSSETPCLMTVRWQNEVVIAPDVTRGGRPTQGLLARVYLFGQQINRPTEGEGSLHFEMADASVSPPKVLEQWNFEPDVVKKFQRPDAVGTGYSVFLASGAYHPDLTQVQLRAAFRPAKGSAIYSTPATVALTPPSLPTGGRVQPPMQLPPQPSPEQSPMQLPAPQTGPAQLPMLPPPQPGVGGF
jgi:hypothetical protein